MTHEPGWWLNTQDMRKTAETAAKIEVLRKAAAEQEKEKFGEK